MKNIGLGALAIGLLAFMFNLANIPPSFVYAQTGACLQRADATKPINAAWIDNSNNEIGFIIERKLNAGAFSELNRVGPNIQTYMDSTIVQGSVDNTYTYRVWSYVLDSKGAVLMAATPTNEACVTIAKLVTPPAPASNLTLN